MNENEKEAFKMGIVLTLVIEGLVGLGIGVGILFF